MAFLKSFHNTTDTVWFHSYEAPGVVRSMDTESTVVGVPGDAGRQEWKSLFHGYGVLVLQDERVLEIGCTTMWIYLTRVNCTFKMVKVVNFILCVSYHNNNKKKNETELGFPPGKQKHCDFWNQGFVPNHTLTQLGEGIQEGTWQSRGAQSI